jgi:hypothetical protein
MKNERILEFDCANTAKCHRLTRVQNSDRKTLGFLMPALFQQ